MPRQRTYVYIDGFNLYYSSLKDTPYKWLDLSQFIKRILPSDRHSIEKIKFFTARISARQDDPDAPTRQDIYLRALKTHCPDVEIIEGFFLTKEVNSFLSPKAGKGFVKTIKTEEKGSDVNLAVHMLNDAWRNLYDCAVMLSNDSDMCGSIRLIKEYCKKRIGWCIQNQPTSHPSKTIEAIVDFQKRFKRNDLEKSQLPKQIPNTNITKPLCW